MTTPEPPSYSGWQPPATPNPEAPPPLPPREPEIPVWAPFLALFLALMIVLLVGGTFIGVVAIT